MTPEQARAIETLGMDMPSADHIQGTLVAGYSLKAAQ